MTTLRLTEYGDVFRIERLNTMVMANSQVPLKKITIVFVYSVTLRVTARIFAYERSAAQRDDQCVN